MDIYLSDLKPEIQADVVRILGDLNWEVTPLFTIEGGEEWEVVEPCPHCGSENIWHNLDPEACGYIAKCGECGRKIFLCDECQHADDAKDCDWHEENGKSICFRGVIEE